MPKLCMVTIVLFATLLPGIAQARIKKPTLRDQEQAACYNDAMTLCKDAVPNEAKIEACMRAKIKSVSPGCRAFFK